MPAMVILNIGSPCASVADDGLLVEACPGSVIIGWYREGIDRVFDFG
jgi:hypothetical protein